MTPNTQWTQYNTAAEKLETCIDALKRCCRNAGTLEAAMLMPLIARLRSEQLAVQVLLDHTYRKGQL